MRGFSIDQREEFFEEDILKRLCFSVERCIEGCHFVFFFGTFLFGLHRTREEFFTDNHSFEGWRSLQRSILHVAGFVTEDRSKEFFLRSRIAFSLRSHLTDKDIPRFDIGSDAYDTVFIEVFGSILGYVRDIVGEFLYPELSITYIEGILVDMDRGEDILTDYTFGDHNRILEVVPFPRHEGYLHIAT